MDHRASLHGSCPCEATLPIIAPKTTQQSVIAKEFAAFGRSYVQVLSEYPNAKALLVTATPKRLDGHGLVRDLGGIADEPTPGHHDG